MFMIYSHSCACTYDATRANEDVEANLKSYGRHCNINVRGASDEESFDFDPKAAFLLGLLHRSCVLIGASQSPGGPSAAHPSRWVWGGEDYGARLPLFSKRLGAG